MKARLDLAEIILIHTSVKLVTRKNGADRRDVVILIHTSVKLVTHRIRKRHKHRTDFNPHEREARDKHK